jgi:hypothetical protein
MRSKKSMIVLAVLAIAGLVAGMFASPAKAGGGFIDPNGSITYPVLNLDSGSVGGMYAAPTINGGGFIDPNGSTTSPALNLAAPVGFSSTSAEPTNPTDQSPFQEKEIDILYNLKGENAGDGYGWLGARLGDLNGDGVNEFLVTAPFYNGFHGKIYLYSGADGSLIDAVAAPDVEYFGYAARDAGDVNRDGVSDYIVGAPAGNRAVVYSGADQTVLRQFSEAPGNAFGSAVSGAGDLNHDGYADVIVGASRYSPKHKLTWAGRVDAYSGKDGALLWSYAGIYDNGRLGTGVGALGDVNDDGVPDVVAAASSGGPNGTGEAYVLSGVDGTPIYTFDAQGTPGETPTYGAFFALGAGDLNQDNYPDIYIGDYSAENGNGKLYIYSGKDGSPLYIFDGKPGEGLGPGRGTPDLDRDHHPDLIVAAYTAGSNEEGKIYFYSGRDGSTLYTINGNVPGDELGVDALSLGDLNHDNRQDFMLTAVGNDLNNQSDVGHVYVVSLKPFQPHPYSR